MKELLNISKELYGSKLVLSKIKKIEYKNYDNAPSVKLVLFGTEKYIINGRPYSLSENRFLVVDNNSQIELNIDAEKDVKGVCIFPSKRLLNDVAITRVSSTESLLDQPFQDYNQRLVHSLFSFTDTRTGKFLNQNIPRVLSACKQRKQINLDHFYVQLAECLVDDQLELQGNLKNIASVKKSTQEELFRRVTTAKDFIVDNYTQNSLLDDLAQVALLSKYHFNRTFKALFQLSPYQYLLQLRLDKAKELLRQDYSYNEVSSRVGFSDGKNLRKTLKRMESSSN